MQWAIKLMFLTFIGPAIIILSQVIRIIGDFLSVFTLVTFSTRSFHSIIDTFDEITMKILFDISRDQLDGLQNLQTATNVLFHDIPKMVIFLLIYIELIYVPELEGK